MTTLREHSTRPCLSCGYDLSKAPVPTCPECGTDFDPKTLPWPRSSVPPFTIALRLAALLPVLYGLSFLSVSAPTPRLLSPFPLFTTMLLFTGLPAALCAIGPTIIGSLFLASLIPGHTRIPAWSRVVAALLLACALTWVAVSVRLSLRYQSPTYAWTMVLIPCIVTAAVIWIALKNRNQPTFKTHVAFVLTITFWVVWGAFPWMGEVI